MIQSVVKEFIKAFLNLIEALMLKKQKEQQIEQTMNEVKNAQTEQDFKDAAHKLDDVDGL